MTEFIDVTIEDRVALIRLNRPKQLNALHTPLARELVEESAKFAADPDVGCIVLTGDMRAFAAGADISEMAGLSYAEIVAKNHFAEFDAFAALPIPKVAAVNGFALGGGCELMMMCDFAIAGKSAKFGQPEIKLGAVAAIGGTQRLTRLVGRALAMDLNLTGRMMDAQEALRAGLVARVLPDEDVLPEALRDAKTIASYSKPCAQKVRDAVNRSEEMTLAEGCRYERQVFYACFGTHDLREGMTAFLEKRAPEFKGE